MSFKEISDENYGTAFKILHPDRMLTPAERELSYAAQLAVKSMVEGTPLLGRYAETIKPEDFKIPGRPHHNALHTSLARMLEEGHPKERKDIALTLAADTVTQIDSWHIDMALKLGFVDTMDKTSQAICREVEANPDLHEEVKLRRVGSYHRLPEDAQKQIETDLARPGEFIPQINAAMESEIKQQAVRTGLNSHYNHISQIAQIGR